MNIKKFISVIVILIFSVSAQSAFSQSKNLEALEVNQNQSLYQAHSIWTTHNNENIQLADFSGQPVIVVMFYGQCTGTCPVLMQRTWKLYQEISEDVREKTQIFAVSFDYKNDTPGALKAYAEYEQLELPNWHFVTSEHSSIRELAMLLGVQYRERSDGHFEHTNLITVLDRDGKIDKRIDGLTGNLEQAAKRIEWIITEPLQ